jgi:hypothetical protein
MLIYVNGCSHTFGHCLTEQEKFESEIYSHKNWATLVAKKVFNDNFNILPNANYLRFFYKNDNFLINEASSGGSNQKIQYTTIQTISKLKRSNIKVDYAFIQLTSVSRRMHITPNGNYIDVNPYENEKYGLRFEPMGTILTLHHIINLQNFFNINGIKYLFIPYFDNINYEFDEQKIIDFNKFTKDFFEGYINEFKEKKYVCDKQGHPNEIGNQIISDDVITSLKNQYDFKLDTEKNEFIRFNTPLQMGKVV